MKVVRTSRRAGQWSRPLFGYLGIVLALTLFGRTLIRPAAASSNEAEQQNSSAAAPEAPQVAFPANAGTLGAIPDGPAGGNACGDFGAPRDVIFTVSGMSTPITDMSISITGTHSYGGDLEVTLMAPNGTAATIFKNTGAATATDCGDSSDLAGPYVFGDGSPASPTWWGAAAAAGAAAVIPGGSFRTSAALTGSNTALISVFAGIPSANGTWTLRVRDGGESDTGSITAATLNLTSGTPPANHPVMDFDGDGKSDDVVARNVGGSMVWYFLNGAGFRAINFGNFATDYVVPGDYDGDFKWDVAVWRSGTFYILQSSTGTLRTQPFGQEGSDDPSSTQDYDGDGKADPTVVRYGPGPMTFYILRSTAGLTGVAFGTSDSDVPIRGDFDGDGKADVAVYRNNLGSPANTFFAIPSGGGPLFARTFGNYNSDYMVPADFDGDRKTDIAVWRGSSAGGNGAWYWLRSSDGSFNAVQFGIGGGTSHDRPVPGDYDGDGRTDQAVWRPGASAAFYHNGSTAGVTGVGFGTTGDYPVAEFQTK